MDFLCQTQPRRYRVGRKTRGGLGRCPETWPSLADPWPVLRPGPEAVWGRAASPPTNPNISCHSGPLVTGQDSLCWCPHSRGRAWIPSLALSGHPAQGSRTPARAASKHFSLGTGSGITRCPQQPAIVPCTRGPVGPQFTAVSHGPQAGSYAHPHLPSKIIMSEVEARKILIPPPRVLGGIKIVSLLLADCQETPLGPDCMGTLSSPSSFLPFKDLLEEKLV